MLNFQVMIVLGPPNNKCRLLNYMYKILRFPNHYYRSNYHQMDWRNRQMAQHYQLQIGLRWLVKCRVSEMCDLIGDIRRLLAIDC